MNTDKRYEGLSISTEEFQFLNGSSNCNLNYAENYDMALEYIKSKKSYNPENNGKIFYDFLIADIVLLKEDCLENIVGELKAIGHTKYIFLFSSEELSEEKRKEAERINGISERVIFYEDRKNLKDYMKEFFKKSEGF